jgi:hypothetical protein
LFLLNWVYLISCWCCSLCCCRLIWFQQFT